MRKLLKLYILGTKKHINLIISQQNTVTQVIKHVIQLISESSNISIKLPSTDPAGKLVYIYIVYELRLLEDDDDYIPMYDIAPFDIDKTIGQLNVDALAFTRRKSDFQKPKPRKTTNSLKEVMDSKSVSIMYKYYIYSVSI